jgi:DeoR family transcriptional regulator, fructose operon transcriptional repressor
LAEKSQDFCYFYLQSVIKQHNQADSDREKMLAEERRMQLIEWSKLDGRIDALAAAGKLNVAVETVRRDLDVLQRRGLLRRVHGGAIAASRYSHEFTFPERKGRNPNQKLRIAQIAAQYLPEEGCIFVDGGTTTEFLAESLINKPQLMVVTNSLSLASRIGESSTPVFLLSGRVRATTLSSVGARTVEDLASYNAQIAFLGANGIDLESGFTTVDPDEAAVKKVMIQNATETIVLADNSKFGASYSALFAGFENIDRLVTDVDADPGHVEALTEKGIEVVLA